MAIQLPCDTAGTAFAPPSPPKCRPRSWRPRCASWSSWCGSRTPRSRCGRQSNRTSVVWQLICTGVRSRCPCPSPHLLASHSTPRAGAAGQAAGGTGSRAAAAVLLIVAQCYADGRDPIAVPADLCNITCTCGSTRSMCPTLASHLERRQAFERFEHCQACCRWLTPLELQTLTQASPCHLQPEHP